MEGEGERANQERGKQFLRICISQPSSPALHGNNGVALAQQTKTHSLVHSPPQTLVNVILPDGLVEVWLSLRVNEGIDTTVQV